MNLKLRCLFEIIVGGIVVSNSHINLRGERGQDGAAEAAALLLQHVHDVHGALLGGGLRVFRASTSVFVRMLWINVHSCCL